VDEVGIRAEEQIPHGVWRVPLGHAPC